MSVISFIVPLFNHLAHTQAMLASMQESLPAGLDYEIILVDDFSTDGTRSWLQTLSAPNLKVVLNSLNLGFARANHAGIAVARGDVLALVNSDLLFGKDWLAPMLTVLHNPQLNVGVVGNVQCRVADGALDHAGVEVNALGQLQHVQAPPPMGSAYARVFAVTGACCLVRRDVFNAVGGFDEGFVNGGEDIDLCMKLKTKGLHAYVAYASVVQHHVSLSRDRTSLQNELNSRLLFQKWRDVIKAELAKHWQYLLGDKAGDSSLEDLVRYLKPSFKATPFTAAQVLSENALLRQEARWCHLLDGVNTNAGLANDVRCTGLRRSANGTDFDLKNSVIRVEISLPNGLKSLDGFYVSGQQAYLPIVHQTQVTISVNGIQEKTFILGTERHFNLGITKPLVLPLLINSFEIKFEAMSPQGALSFSDPCQYITVSHLVIDGQVLADL